MVKVKPVQLGKTERMSFSRIDEVIDMPNLIEVQKNSYNWFLKEGLKEVFRDISTIEDYSGNLVLDFIDYRLDSTSPNTPSRSVKSATPPMPRRCASRARLLNKETGEVKEQEIFMGDFPLMTDSGTFCHQRRRARHRLPAGALARACTYGMKLRQNGQRAVHRHRDPQPRRVAGVSRRTPTTSSMCASTRTARYR